MAGATLLIDDGPIDVWAEHWSIDLVHKRPTIGELAQDDAARWLPEVRAVIRECLADPELTEPKAGGHRRIGEIADVDSNAMELLALRASKLCKAMMNTDRVALEDASALVVGRSQSVPGASMEHAVATVTCLLAGPPKLAFEHTMHRAVRHEPDRSTPVGTFWVHPSDMPVRVPLWTADDPLMLAVFNYRRLI